MKRRLTRLAARLDRRVRGAAASLAAAVASGRWHGGLADLALGRLTRFGLARIPEAAAVLAGPDERLIVLARGSDASRRLLLRRGQALSLEEAFDCAVEPELVQLSGATIAGMSDDASAKSQLLYRVVVLDGAAAGAGRIGAALLAATRTAATLRSEDARGILLFCLRLAAQGPGPYDMDPIINRARSAAVAIIQEHPELDDEVVDQALAGALSSTLELMGTAFRGRPYSRWAAVVWVIETAKLNTVAARRFAEDCDARRQTGGTGSPRTPNGGGAWVGDRYSRVRLLFPFLVAPAIASAVAKVAAVWTWSRLPPHVDLGAAIGALAALIAIHVVAAELAADRLPGLVARNTTSSPAIISGYGAALALATVAATQGDNPAPAWTWATAILLVAFVLVVGGSIVQLLARIDSARAAEDFRRSQEPSVRRAGREVGRVLRDAKACKEVLESRTYVTLRSSPAKTERRVVVVASARGSLFVNAPKSEPGVRWYVKSDIGAVANEGDEVIALVPDPSATVNEQQISQARRSIAIRSVARAEEVEDMMSALIDIAGRVAARGERGGAERASRAGLALLAEHLNAVRSVANSTEAESLSRTVVIPAVQAAVTGTIGMLSQARNAIEYDVMCSLAEGLLDVCQPSDGATVMAITALGGVGADLPVHIASRILVRAGIRALEGDDEPGLIAVWQGFRRRIGSTVVVQRVALDAGQVAASAVWLNYSRGRQAWRTVWSMFDGQNSTWDPVRMTVAAQVGGAALLAGFISVALDIALKLRGSGLDLAAFGTYMTSPAMLAMVQKDSDQGSGYLGQSPKDGVANFVEFTTRVAAAVTN